MIIIANHLTTYLGLQLGMQYNNKAPIPVTSYLWKYFFIFINSILCVYIYIVGELANAWGCVLFPVQNELKWYIVNDVLFSMAEINMTVYGVC